MSLLSARDYLNRTKFNHHLSGSILQSRLELSKLDPWEKKSTSMSNLTRLIRLDSKLYSSGWERRCLALNYKFQNEYRHSISEKKKNPPRPMSQIENIEHHQLHLDGTMPDENVVFCKGMKNLFVSNLPSESKPWILSLPSDQSEVSALTNDLCFDAQTLLKQQHKTIKKDDFVLREEKRFSFRDLPFEKEERPCIMYLRNEEAELGYKPSFVRDSISSPLQRRSNNSIPRPLLLSDSAAKYNPSFVRDSISSPLQLRRCRSDNSIPRPVLLTNQRQRCESDSAANMQPRISIPQNSNFHVRRHSVFSSLREVLSYDEYEDSPPHFIESSLSSTSTLQTSDNDSNEDAGSFSRLLLQNQNYGFIKGRVRVSENQLLQEESQRDTRRWKRKSNGFKSEVKFIFRRVTKLVQNPKLIRNSNGYLA